VLQKTIDHSDCLRVGWHRELNGDIFMKPILLASIFVLMTISSASGEVIPIKNMLEMHDNNVDFRKSIQTRIGGIGDGMMWTMVQGENKKQFCPPKTLHLSDEIYFGIFRQEIENNKPRYIDKSQKLLPEILWNGLNRIFPCPPS
jgi:hypothetical protein